MHPRRAVACLLSGVLALGVLAGLIGPAEAVTAGSDPKLQPVACAEAELWHVRCLIDGVADLGTSTRAGVVPTADDALNAAEIRDLYDVTGANPSAIPTVAIINVGHNPIVENDLNAYRTANDIVPCTTANGCFSEYDLNGAKKPNWTQPPLDEDWYVETALDLDMVSATCPQCRIMMVDAPSTDFLEIVTAVAVATDLGATYVSLSLVAQDIDVRASSYAHPADIAIANFVVDTFSRPGVNYFASSGDWGYDPSPAGDAQDPNDRIGLPSTLGSVVSVGGTFVDRTPSGFSETAWNSAGSGCSHAMPMGDQQKTSADALAACPSTRAVSDVSGIADADGGAVLIFANGGWSTVSGTSVTAPIIASMAAIANAPDALTALYQHLEDDDGFLNDVSAGANGTCAGSRICNAAGGWDGPTGVGTPRNVKAFNKAATTYPAAAPVYTRSVSRSATATSSSSAGGDVVKASYTKRTSQVVSGSYSKKVKGKTRTVTKKLKVGITRTSSVRIATYPSTGSATTTASGTCAATTVEAATSCAANQALTSATASANAQAQQAAVNAASAAADQARTAARTKATAAAKKAANKVKRPTSKDVSAAKKAAKSAAKTAWLKKYAKKK